MSTSPASSKPAGSSLWKGKPVRTPSQVVLNLDELLKGEESAEYTDSEEEDEEMSDATSESSDDALNFLLHGAEADSSDDDDDEYEENDIQAPTDTAKKVKQTALSQVTKKIAGTSLPPRKHEPLPPVNLDEALAGEESDEYVTSEDEESADDNAANDSDLTVLLFGDGSASDNPGDEDETDLEDGEYPGPHGRRTRSQEKALRAARDAMIEV